MRRVLSMILVLMMVLSMVPVFSAAAAEPVIITSGSDVLATVEEPVTYTWVADANGTLTVTMGAASPGWRYTITDGAGNTVGLPKSGKTEKSAEFELVAGTQYTFSATGFNTSSWDPASANITYTLSFLADEGEEVVVSEYEVSDTALLLGDNTLTLSETAVTTIYVFAPTETAVYTFTAPEGAVLGYWGAGSWFLQNPNSTTNTYEWTCTGVGQTAYIGVSGVEGTFNVNVAKTGDYTVVEVPIIPYENKAVLEPFTLPTGYQMHDYIDITAETIYTAVLGDDGYYHLDSADGDIILVDMDYQDIILSAALKSDRPVMYVWETDEDGNQVKYDIGNAVLAYEEVMDSNGYYPLTEDLIYFYDDYANGAAIYSYHLSGAYNAENAWLYCMRTVTFPDVTEPETTEPEATEPEVTEPEVSEPEVTEPEVTEPEITEPEASEPTAGVVVLQENISVTTGSKYVYTYTPEEDGTLFITVGDGTTSWNSDVIYFVGVSTTTVGSASGQNSDTYQVAVTAGTKYRIRVWTPKSAEIPLTIVFQSDAGTSTEPTEPTEPEIIKKDYEVSGTNLTVGTNSVTMLDTAIATIFKFMPTEVGTYTFTGPDGAFIGNWGSNAYYLTNPNSTSNSCEWTCTGVGQSVFIGVCNVEGGFNLDVALKVTEPEVTEPVVTEPEVTEPEATEPVPSIPDDIPSDAYYSVTVNGQTTYFNTSSADTLNTQLKQITGTGYVKLYKDLNLGSSIFNALTFDAGNVTLDLNGCTISFACASVGVLYVDGGTLTVVDTSIEGKGLVQNTHANGYGIQIWTGTCNLVSGNIEAISNGLRVENIGTLNMFGGQVTAQKYGINVMSNAVANVSGGIVNQTVVDSFNRTLQAASTTSASVTGGYFNGGAVFGSGLVGKISGGYFTASFNANYLASDCELQNNDDAVYLYKVYNPNAEPEEPEEPDVTEPTEPTEPSEPSEPATEPTEPSEPETEPTEPSEPETEPSEPAQSGELLNLVNEQVTVNGYVFEYTAATAGTVNVTVGSCSPGWRYKVYYPSGTETIYNTKYNGGENGSFEDEAGNWKIIFYAYSSAQADNVAGSVSFTVSFTPKDSGGSGEVEKAEYEVSEMPLVLGDNTLSLLDTAVTTIYVFEPTETGVYTFTAPAGAILGYWGAGSWFLQNPNSTTNTYEWTCTGVGQTAYIGVSGADGSFNLNVAKTGDYEVVEIPIVKYENKAELDNFTLPEGAVLGDYIDVTGDTIITVVLGEDGYYHLNTADGPIILVDMNYQDIILSNALLSDRPVMYAYTTDENGNKIKYDIGDAIKEYEAVMDANGYYPLTDDLIMFYDTYAVGAAVYTFYVTGDYNEDNVWLYCMRTFTVPVKPVDSWNLVLEDDLKVNFYMNMGENDSVQVSVGGNTYTFNAADLEVKDDKYVVTISIAAAQMTDEITVQIVGSDEVNTYTVRQYADTVLADETLSSYHALIKAMLNYGAAAQTYFKYNTENPANTDIIVNEVQDVPETTTEMVVSDQISGLNFYGASVVYRDKIAVRFYFTGSIEGINFGEYTVNEKEDKYYIEVADILPQNLDQQITVTVTDAEGNAIIVTYGPMNYIVRMNAKGDENVKNLMKALYNYYLAAKALRVN